MTGEGESDMYALRELFFEPKQINMTYQSIMQTNHLCNTINQPTK